MGQRDGSQVSIVAAGEQADPRTLPAGRRIGQRHVELQRRRSGTLAAGRILRSQRIHSTVDRCRSGRAPALWPQARRRSTDSRQARQIAASGSLTSWPTRSSTISTSVSQPRRTGRRVERPRRSAARSSRRTAPGGSPNADIREKRSSPLAPRVSARIELSAEFGGLGLRFSAKLRAVEELAKHDFAFAFALVNHHNALQRIAHSAPAIARRLVPRMLTWRTDRLLGLYRAWARQRSGGARDLGPASRRRLDPRRPKVLDHERGGGRRRHRAGADRPGQRSGRHRLVCRRGRAARLRAASPMNMLHVAFAMGVGGFRLENYFADDEALVAPPGAGFKQSLSGINGARAYVAAMCAGMLDSALDEAVRGASTRHAFGQPVIDFQGLRWSLVDAETDLAALRLLAYRAAAQIDEGIQCRGSGRASQEIRRRPGPGTRGCLRSGFGRSRTARRCPADAASGGLPRSPASPTARPR